MSSVNILIAILGSAITLMVLVGMVLITPGGTEAHTQTSEADLQQSPAPRREPIEADLVTPEPVAVTPPV